MFVQKGYMKNLDFIFEKRFIFECFDEFRFLPDIKTQDIKTQKTRIIEFVKDCYGDGETKGISDKSINKYLEFCEKVENLEIYTHFSQNELFEIVKICAEI